MPQTPAAQDPDLQRLLDGLGSARRVLLLGEPGTGKSSLAVALARSADQRGAGACCLAADPGSPPFGLPGALALGRWSGGEWAVLELAALATLDAARFRLPLVQAAASLARRAPPGLLLVDAPGVTRGVAGAELAWALAEATGAEALVVLARPGRPPPLAQELTALGRPLFTLAPPAGAHRLSARARAEARTGLWDTYLAGATRQRLGWRGLARLGTPPPDQPAAWQGRLAGFHARGELLGLGEIESADADGLWVRSPAPLARCDALLVRDARRRGDGLVGTSPPTRSARPGPGQPELAAMDSRPQTGPGPVIRVEPASASLVNGVTGDPMLHLRLRHQRRSLLFDLGDPGRLPARVAHQVSDVFVTHAHFDHIGGFPWLLRSRIAPLPPCRLYGPPGLADHVEGQVRGVLWDRVGDRAPRFQVAELHGERLHWFRVTAGQPGPAPGALTDAPGGLLLDEPGFRVRAVTLDHGTPVLAFAFEPREQVNIRPERLREAGLAPGPWLGALKNALLAGRPHALIQLPDGTEAPAAELGERFARTRPGRRLVYATDLADTGDNRRRLAALARGADTLVCEAPFLLADAEQARRTGHLTTEATAAIANRAGVRRLVAFHFSRRYGGELAALYRELAELCPVLERPGC